MPFLAYAAASQRSTRSGFLKISTPSIPGWQACIVSYITHAPADNCSFHKNISVNTMPSAGTPPRPSATSPPTPPATPPPPPVSPRLDRTYVPRSPAFPMASTMDHGTAQASHLYRSFRCTTFRRELSVSIAFWRRPLCPFSGRTASFLRHHNGCEGLRDEVRTRRVECQRPAQLQSLPASSASTG